MQRGGDRGGGERSNAPWTSFNDEGMVSEKFEAYYKVCSVVVSTIVSDQNFGSSDC